MSAKSLIQKLKRLVGLSDGSGPERDASSPEKTDVTVEREPEPRAPREEPAAAEPEAEAEVAAESEAELTTEDDPSAERRGESVEKIKGIGPTYSERLESDGLETVAQLADSDAETVAEVAETTEGRAAEWIKRAKNR